MRLLEAIETYLAELADGGYGELERRKKGSILRRHLSHAVALYHPAVPRNLARLSEIRLYGRRTIGVDVEPRRREAAEHFLAVFRSRRISYLALETFVAEYSTEHLVGKADAVMRARAIRDLCCALGLEIELRTIDRRTYDRVLGYLRDQAVDRAAGYSASFFGYCRRQGRLSFDPPSRFKGAYRRVFDPDFLGTGDGLWTGRLRLYLEYLKNEKNLSDGGIDYYARKLRIFVRWLDGSGTRDRVSTATVKEFLAEREKRGVKALTRAKYVYAVRYFFDYLLSKGFAKINPATGLRVKADPTPEQPILSQLEVAQVIEHLEGRVFETRNPEAVKDRMCHFRALRDLCLFLLFTLTGVRASAALGMKLGDLDFIKRSVRIQAKGNRAYRKKHREILLPDALWSRLTQYLRLRSHAGAGPLWISWSGRPMTGPRVSTVIVDRVRQAGIDKQISPHRLRATCASLYLKRGMDPFSLKTLLGHQSIATTMDHYLRFTEEELREVWKRTNPLAGTDDE